LGPQIYRKDGVKCRGVAEKITVVGNGERDVDGGNRHVIGRAIQILPAAIEVEHVLHATIVAGVTPVLQLRIHGAGRKEHADKQDRQRNSPRPR